MRDRSLYRTRLDGTNMARFLSFVECGQRLNCLFACTKRGLRTNTSSIEGNHSVLQEYATQRSMSLPFSQH